MVDQTIAQRSPLPNLKKIKLFTNCSLIVVIKRVGNFNQRRLMPWKDWLLKILRADHENAHFVPAAPPTEMQF
jgi:hypothetical protein